MRKRNQVKAKIYGLTYMTESLTLRPHSTLHSTNCLFLKETKKARFTQVTLLMAKSGSENQMRIKPYPSIKGMILET